MQAGEWRAAVEELPEFVSYPDVGADEAELGLRVRGDSMQRFPGGSTLYCNRYNEQANYSDKTRILTFRSTLQISEKFTPTHIESKRTVPKSMTSNDLGVRGII